MAYYYSDGRYKVEKKDFYTCNWCGNKARHSYTHDQHDTYAFSGTETVTIYLCNTKGCEELFNQWLKESPPIVRSSMKKSCAIKQWTDKLAKEKSARDRFLEQLPDKIKELIANGTITVHVNGSFVDLTICDDFSVKKMIKYESYGWETKPSATYYRPSTYTTTEPGYLSWAFQADTTTVAQPVEMVGSDEIATDTSVSEESV